MNINSIKEKIENFISNSRVEVKDTTGTGDHFSLIVISNDFEKMSLIERHRMIYSIFEQEITKEIHALQIQTYTKSEWKQKNK